jgi:hypothetical protein
MMGPVTGASGIILLYYSTVLLTINHDMNSLNGVTRCSFSHSGSSQVAYSCSRRRRHLYSARCRWLRWHMDIPKRWLTVQHWVQHLDLMQHAIGLPQPSLMLPKCSFPVCPARLLILNVRTDTWIIG